MTRFVQIASDCALSVHFFLLFENGKQFLVWIAFQADESSFLSYDGVVG